MLKFSAQHGEYWDNAGAQGLKFVFEAAKAYVKGERAQENDVRQHAEGRPLVRVDACTRQGALGAREPEQEVRSNEAPFAVGEGIG